MAQSDGAETTPSIHCERPRAGLQATQAAEEASAGASLL